MKNFLLRPIPTKYLVLIFMFALTWHVGTQNPYADVRLIGLTLDWVCGKTNPLVEKWFKSYQLRTCYAWHTLYPNGACVSCYLHTRQMLLLTSKFKKQRAYAIALEKRAKIYNESVARGVYPVRGRNGFLKEDVHAGQKSI